MIAEGTFYGLSVTDEFGHPLYAMQQVFAYIQKHYYDEEYGGYNEPPWLVTFPSAEEDQLVIGFDVVINKKTNYEKLDEKWQEILTIMPAPLGEALKTIEPDVIHLSGHC